MERAKQIADKASHERSVSQANAYVRCAQWADANPSEETIMQIVEAYKLWVSEFYTMPLTEFVVRWINSTERGAN